MNPNEFSRHLRRMNDEVRRAVNSDIPKKVAAKAVSLFKRNFQDEGFFGRKWKDVQRRQTHTVSYKTKSGVKTRTVPPAKGADGTRKILTGRTGDLGRSIRWKTEPGRAVIYSDLPYAAAHNDGTTSAGRRHNVRLAKRQFIGDHATLTRAVKDIINRHLRNIIK